MIAEIAGTSPVRTCRINACRFIAFYYAAADWVTAFARVRTIRNAATNQSSLEECKNYAVRDHLLTLNFEGLWKTVDARLNKLAEPERMVIGDPEWYAGCTRHARSGPQRAVLLAEGIPAKKILQAYPNSTE